MYEPNIDVNTDFGNVKPQLKLFYLINKSTAEDYTLADPPALGPKGPDSIIFYTQESGVGTPRRGWRPPTGNPGSATVTTFNSSGPSCCFQREI